MGILSKRKEPVSRVFVNRNKTAEMQFYNKYDVGVGFANAFTIPLLKEFGVDITIDVICDYQKGDTRDRFLDLLIGRKTSERILPAELRRLQDEASKEFDEVLAKVIKQGHRVKATKERHAKSRKRYEDKIDGLNRELSKYSPVQPKYGEISKEISEVSNFLSRQESNNQEDLQNVIDDEKRLFMKMSVETYDLSFASGFLVFDGETIQIDKAKVTAALGVYASTPQEIALLDKLKQLAALTNEIYGGKYPGALAAFSMFFMLDHGKVVLSSDIEQGTLTEYSKTL